VVHVLRDKDAHLDRAQVIPDDAVEVAARAYNAEPARPWGALAPMVRRIRLQKMRAALEAAAPHMMAKAWDEGMRSGKSRAMRAMSDEPGLSLKIPNPYRKDSP
jgi:hypothetical protein